MADFPADSIPDARPSSTLVHDDGKARGVKFDVLVVGAGPTGLACAIEAQKAGFKVVLVDKGCVCNSLFHYPSHMTFFTTPELLEIGDIPFPSPNPKPTRNEALQSVSLRGLYPGGEGCGYAGGIVSSGIDGLRIAEQIAKELSLSVDTVRNHIRHLMRTLGVHSRLEAVAVAHHERLIVT